MLPATRRWTVRELTTVALTSLYVTSTRSIAIRSATAAARQIGTSSHSRTAFFLRLIKIPPCP